MRLKRIGTWVVSFAVALVMLNYLADAKSRREAAADPSRWSSSISDTGNGAYTVKTTYLTKELTLLRLYRTGNSKLLAERTVRENGMRLIWTDDKLIYDTSLDEGAIHLPPTLRDEWLARLP